MCLRLHSFICFDIYSIVSGPRSTEKSDMSRPPLHVFKCQSVTLPEINITEFLWHWFGALTACHSSGSFSVAICFSLGLRVACCLPFEPLGFLQGGTFMILLPNRIVLLLLE